MHNSSDLRSISEAKDKAKRLYSILAPVVSDIKLGQCQEFYAKLEGYRSWGVFSKALQENPERGIPFEDIFATIDKVVSLIKSHAVNYGMSVSVNTISKKAVANQDFSLGFPGASIEIDLFPDNIEGCNWSVRIHATDKAVNIEGGFLYFSFPAEASATATKLLYSKALNDDQTPTLMRSGLGREETSWLRLETGISCCSLADPGKNIFNDEKQVFDEIEKSLLRILPSHKELYEAYGSLSRDWSNKKGIKAFEAAIWKQETGEPFYMSASNIFHRAVFGSLAINACVSRRGDLYLSCDRGSADLGVSSIMHLQKQHHKDTPGYYIAKYGNDPLISLAGLSDDEIRHVAAEFGFPLPFEWQINDGKYEEGDFFDSPAFLGLKAWVSKNPLFAKRVGKKGSAYLKNWYEKVIA